MWPCINNFLEAQVRKNKDNGPGPDKAAGESQIFLSV